MKACLGIRILLIAIMMVAFVTFEGHGAPRETVDVTIHEGERQTFKGFGGTLQYYPYYWRARRYSQLSTHLLDSISSMIWGDLNMQYMRIWSSPYAQDRVPFKDEYYAPLYAAEYNLVIDAAKKYQPNLIVYHTPFSRNWMGESIANVNDWAAHCAAQLFHFRRHGIQLDWTGIANEPEVHDEITTDNAPILVRQYRRELDRLGLDDIKLCAPEAAGTDDKGISIVKSILDDPDALEALDAISTHSYNFSITDRMVKLVEPLIMGKEKEYWQTESSAGPCIDEFPGNAALGSETAARFLADMNHLCNVWMWFLVLQGQYDNWSEYRCFGWMMIGFRHEYDVFDDAFFIPMKYYYMKLLATDFRPGAIMRQATAHTNRVSGKYWRAEDTTMAFVWGEKAPLYVAGGVNPDGSWVIGINNHTGFTQEAQSTPRPTVDFTVRIKVEDLTGRGDIAFGVRRCNADSGQGPNIHIHEEDTVYMHDGLVVVDSVGKFDLVTLRSLPGVEEGHTPSFATKKTVVGALKVARTSASQTVIRFRVDGPEKTTKVPVGIAIYDFRGKLVRRFKEETVTPGERELTWDNCNDKGVPLSAGAYFIRLSSKGVVSSEALVRIY